MDKESIIYDTATISDIPELVRLRILYMIDDFGSLTDEERESTGMSRKEFSEHTGIPVRTLEDWEAGRRTPPQNIPRLIEYQLKYEELVKKGKKG